jgi:hypothetical protein
MWPTVSPATLAGKKDYTPRDGANFFARSLAQISLIPLCAPAVLAIFVFHIAAQRMCFLWQSPAHALH